MITALQSDLFRITLGRDLSFDFHISGLALVVAILFVLLAVVFRYRRRPSFYRLELNEAEFGLGDQKITLRPNTTDLQIAYKIWVELSTRKIGLPIDLDNDVISEVYDSWYEFFSVTREHIKEVPATRFRRRDTSRIIRLSIDVLNVGVRPHLTKWQARFRRWYQHALNNDKNLVRDPQDVQKDFPLYKDLVQDLSAVNGRLIRYRQTLQELLTEAGSRQSKKH